PSAICVGTIPRSLFSNLSAGEAVRIKRDLPDLTDGGKQVRGCWRSTVKLPTSPLSPFVRVHGKLRRTFTWRQKAMPRRDAAAELGAKMLEKLRQLRDTGEYPVSVRRLGEMADPAAPAELVARALSRKTVGLQLLIAFKKDPTSPVVLAADGARLADSADVLRGALARLCSVKRAFVT